MLYNSPINKTIIAKRAKDTKGLLRKGNANMRKKELASELTSHFFKPTLQEEAKPKRWQKWLFFLAPTSLFALYLVLFVFACLSFWQLVL